MTLRYLGDLSHSEIAEVVETGQEAARRSVFEGLKRLRREVTRMSNAHDGDLRPLRRAAAEGLVEVFFERHDSPLGSILLGATDAGLVRVGLPAEDEDAVLGDLAERISPRVLAGPRDSVTLARRQLVEYFEGDRQSFDVPLDWRLTRGFRREVLRTTALIPYGRTASYREVATGAGSPGAFRAAGTALATNPLPIVVPCHRVLRSGGGLGDYRGGSRAKAQLLRLEGAM